MLKTTKRKVVSYLMDTPHESIRLLGKSDYHSTEHQLRESGFLNLGTTTPKVLDAGCGAGFVSKVMADLASDFYKEIKLTCLDSSAERLADTLNHLGVTASNVKVSTINSSVDAIPIESNQFDYVFSRFLFEYLPNPESSLRELTRVTKRGGRLVICDLDYNMLTHYPNDPVLAKLTEIIDELRKLNLLDHNVGRKLFGMFDPSSTRVIDIKMFPHHLSWGGISDADLKNWMFKCDRIQELQNSNAITLSFEVESFRSELISYLNRKDHFSYSPLIMVIGEKK